MIVRGGRVRTGGMRCFRGLFCFKAQTLSGCSRDTRIAINTRRKGCEPRTLARFDPSSENAHKKAPPDGSVRGFGSGVPGPVRTANLPLRRGMLYPIELLGQMTAAALKARRRTACMLTAEVGFVMSSVGFLSVGRYRPHLSRPDPENTGPRAHRAKCTPPKSHHCKLQPFNRLK